MNNSSLEIHKRPVFVYQNMCVSCIICWIKVCTVACRFSVLEHPEAVMAMLAEAFPAITVMEYGRRLWCSTQLGDPIVLLHDHQQYVHLGGNTAICENTSRVINLPC